jgi:hypothetical protein
VTVPRGASHTGINFRLTGTVTRLGSISGTITVQPDGASIYGEAVYVYTSSGSLVGVDPALTDDAGHYTVTGLQPSSTGYVVCADRSDEMSVIVPPATGWAPRCYQDTAWFGAPFGARFDGGVPNDAARVPVAAGADTPNVNIVLPVGGAISGSAYVGPGTGTLADVDVELFTADGRFITRTGNRSRPYVLDSLSPASGSSGYVVCFAGIQGSARGYLPQCWDGKAWSGTS